MLVVTDAVSSSLWRMEYRTGSPTARDVEAWLFCNDLAIFSSYGPSPLEACLNCLMSVDGPEGTLAEVLRALRREVHTHFARENHEE